MLLVHMMACLFSIPSLVKKLRHIQPCSFYLGMSDISIDVQEPCRRCIWTLSRVIIVSNKLCFDLGEE